LVDNPGQKVLPLLDHVSELANRLRIWITSFIIATVVFMLLPANFSFFSNPLGLYRPFITVVLQDIRVRVLPSNVQLIAGTFTAPILLYFIASAIFGFTVTVPLLAYQVYKFVDPALTRSERGSAYPFVTGFSLLFIGGAVFGFFILTPLVVWGSIFFFGFTGAAAIVRIDDFYNLVFFTTVASAFAFTLPVFLVLLSKFGILDVKLFTRNRKYLWVVVYIVASLVTPDSNPISDIILFVPVIALVEGALLVSRRYEKSRPPSPQETEITVLRCSYCNGPLDAGGIFCGRCGKSRV
jgi:sec-independent protein translocase protein TatC